MSEIFLFQAVWSQHKELLNDRISSRTARYPATITQRLPGLPRPAWISHHIMVPNRMEVPTHSPELTAGSGSVLNLFSPVQPDVGWVFELTYPAARPVNQTVVPTWGCPGWSRSSPSLSPDWSSWACRHRNLSSASDPVSRTSRTTVQLQIWDQLSLMVE